MGGDLPSAVATWDRVRLRPGHVELRDASYARFLATRSLMSYWTRDTRRAWPATEAHRLGIDASNLEASVTSACNAGLALVGMSRLEEGAIRLDRANRPQPGMGGAVVRRADRTCAPGRLGTGDVEAARVQSREALELAKDSGFPPAAISARLDLLYADLDGRRRGGHEVLVPPFASRSRTPRGSAGSFWWNSGSPVARAEAARLAARERGERSSSRTRRSQAGLAAAGTVPRPELSARPRAPVGRPKQRRPPTCTTRAASRPTGWGARDGRRSRASRTRRASATMTPPRTHGAAVRTSRSSPAD